MKHRREDHEELVLTISRKIVCGMAVRVRESVNTRSRRSSIMARLEMSLYGYSLDSAENNNSSCRTLSRRFKTHQSSFPARKIGMSDKPSTQRHFLLPSVNGNHGRFTPGKVQYTVFLSPSALIFLASLEGTEYSRRRRLRLLQSC